MSTLKELRIRQHSVQSTRKITLAMKMIAAAKLKKAQKNIQDLRPYAVHMAQLIQGILEKSPLLETKQPLLYPREKVNRHLIILITSDRGLCGGFNMSVARHGLKYAHDLQQQGIQPKFICVGYKGYDPIKGTYKEDVLQVVSSPDQPVFQVASKLSKEILEAYEKEEIDRCTLVYNRFVSPMTQEVKEHPLIPFTPLNDEKAEEPVQGSLPPHIYEPSEAVVLEALLPKNLSLQIYRALCENAAGEKGARMTAMDGATRNADEMIRNLSLVYNRTRQAVITKELVEIISGAESLED